MQTEFHPIANTGEDIYDVKWPLDLAVISNYMGINLCSVEGMSMKLLKTIQKEAVLGIQRGDNARRLIMLLSSYIDDETLKRLQASFADDEGFRECLR
jgi:hypothetical protein